MTSRPLFIIVAESMVIFGPIFHVGCLSASSGPIFRSSAFSLEKNGPPEAVSRMPSSSSSLRPSRHWKIAECSESTGMRGFSSARDITHSPPAIRDSLLARATLLPACSAPTVAASPAKPTMPLSTTSAGASESRSAEPGPASTLHSSPSRSAASPPSRATYSGENSRACSRRASALRPAARPTTSKRSGWARTTSRACRPMLPVEPRMVRRRFTRVWGRISYEQRDVVYRGHREEQAVDPVEQAAVAREEAAQVLHVQDALEHRLEQVPALARQGDADRDRERLRHRVVEEGGGEGPNDEHRHDQAAGDALDSLLRAQGREGGVTAEEPAGKICAGVG